MNHRHHTFILAGTVSTREWARPAYGDLLLIERGQASSRYFILKVTVYLTVLQRLNLILFIFFLICKLNLKSAKMDGQDILRPNFDDELREY